jgi:hypothetical protein
MWAEDGAVFLSQAVSHSLVANLFTPYSGYLHFAPRLLAQADTLFPLRDAAWLYAVEGSMVATGCALVVFRATRGLIGSRTLRFTLAAAMLCLPLAHYELLANLVNIQWYLTATVLWVLIWRPRTASGRSVACLVAFLAAGSQPLVAIFLPVAVLRVLTTRTWWENAATIAYAAGLSCQAWSLIAHPAPSASALAYVQAGAPLIAKLFVLRVGLGTLGGTGPTDTLWAHFGILAAIVATLLVIGAVVLGLRRAVRPVQVWAVTAMITGALLFAYMTHARYVLIALAPGQDPLQWDSRYSYVPVILMLAALAMAGGNILTRLPPRTRWVTLTLGLACLVALWIPGFCEGTRAGPTWSVALASADARCHRPGEPVAVTIAPPPWTAQIPCSLLVTSRPG